MGLAWFIEFLLKDVSANEKIWQRYVYLLTGFEAIAFAAAGYLFGREVHRGAARQAQKRAEAADTRANSTDKRAQELERRRNHLEDESKRNHAYATAVGTRLNDVKATVDEFDGRYPKRRTPNTAGIRIVPQAEQSDRPNRTSYRLTGSDFEEHLEFRGNLDALDVLQAREAERDSMEADIRHVKILLDQPLFPEGLEP